VELSSALITHAALAWLAARLADRVVARSAAASWLLAWLTLVAVLPALLLIALSWVAPVGARGVGGALAVAIGLELAARRFWGMGAAAEGAAAAGKWTRSEVGALGLLLALVVAWMLHAALSGPSLVWDDLSYHAALPAFWRTSGSLALPPFTYQAYYPAHSELVALWFLLPAGELAHTKVLELLWPVLGAAAIVRLGAAVGGGRAAASLAAAAFLVSDGVVGAAATFCGSDLAPVALALAGLAWAVPVAGTGERRGARVALAGLAAGAALGAKVSMAPALLAAVALVLADADRSGRMRTGMRFAAAALAAGGLCYLRNLLLTGNPVFPAALGPLSGPLDGPIRLATSIAGALLRPNAEIAIWSDVLRPALSWPAAIAALAAAGWIASGSGRVAGGVADPEATRRLRRVLGATALAGLVLFPLLPFSGTVNRPNADFHLARRYALLPIALGLALYPAWRPTRPLLARIALILPLLAMLSALPRAWREGFGRRHADPYLLFEGARPIAAAWRALDTLPAGARIACFNRLPASHAQYFPLFGPALDLVPVALDRDGAPARPLHESWREDPRRGWWDDFEDEERGSSAGLIERLRESAVDFVLVSRWDRPPGDDWPVQRAELAGLPDDRRVYRDGYSEIWDLRGL